mmetsp:Transcript_22955/g.74852  ORF Transcript_22955/g.74852 Transcript_22955/m.74852 type:complete len:238 (-) Transcript_22955:371-1084(-)
MLGRSSRLSLWFFNRHATSVDVPETRAAVAHLSIEFCSCPVRHLALSIHTLGLVMSTLREASSKGEEVFNCTITLVVLHHPSSTVQADGRESSDSLMFHDVAVMISIQHSKLNLLVAAWWQALLSTMVVGHRCSLCVLKCRLLVCGFGLHAVRTPRRVEHHDPCSSLLKHLQERRVRQLHNSSCFHVAARSLSLVSDAISVDDTSSPIVDEALLATASIYSIELCVGTILLTALMVQ